MTDEDRPGLATQNRLLLEILLENQTNWNAEQTLKRERMAAERETIISEQEQ